MKRLVRLRWPRWLRQFLGMTIEEAVEILNRRNYAGAYGWVVNPNEPDEVLGMDGKVLTVAQAIFVAEGYKRGFRR